MNHTLTGHGFRRRGFLKLGAVLAFSASLPGRVWAAIARPSAAFEATGLEDAFAALGKTPTEHDGIIFTTPDIAENGAVVPVKVEIDGEKLTGVQRIYVMVEMNPNPVAALFDVPAGTEPFVETRVKVAQTGNLYAVAEVDGEFFMKAKETKVTLGGCGG